MASIQGKFSSVEVLSAWRALKNRWKKCVKRWNLRWRRLSRRKPIFSVFITPSIFLKVIVLCKLVKKPEDGEEALSTGRNKLIFHIFCPIFPHCSALLHWELMHSRGKRPNYIFIAVRTVLMCKMHLWLLAPSVF